MESDFRILVACCRPRVLVFHVLFWGLLSLRVLGAALLNNNSTNNKTAAGAAAAGAGAAAAEEAERPPCWTHEEFVVTSECHQCTAYQTRLWAACGATGYVEQVNCTRSNKDEHKSCRSAVMEENLFWRFEAVVLVLTLLLAVLVVTRQRWLDRLASEKVRRQIESI
ncbi:protein JTB isoform X5 [Nelusetta ayraudi]|uniref:protein JTB isoform X5 n=1 Tax=Nelusetta ayraudi TaxID=303726 RepID=UPI003F71056A